MKIRSLTTKLLLPCIMLIVVSPIVSYSISRNQLRETILNSFSSKGLTLSKSLETGIQEKLLDGSSSSVQAFIDEYRALDGIGFIMVIDEYHKVMAHTFYPTIPKEYEGFIKASWSGYSVETKHYDLVVNEDDHLIFEIPILAGLLGHVILGMNYEDELNKALKPLDSFYVFLYIGLMLLFTFLALFVVVRVLKPIRQLTNSAKNFINLNELEIVNNEADGEMAELVEAYNGLVSFAKNHANSLEEEVKDRSTIITQQQEQLVNSARLSMLGEMTTGVAHEINNPLTVLNAGSMVLKKMLQIPDYDKVKVEKIVDDNIKMIQRISKIVTGMRNISRDGSKDPFELSRLGDIFEDSLSILSQKMKSNNVELRCDLSREVFNTSIYCRRIELSQVLVNLLGNAYDAVVELENPWIEVECLTSDNVIKILITDSGRGIPLDIQERVFVPFVTTKAVGKGTGLGLSLCMRIAKNHGGSISIDNSVQNTRFVVTLLINPKKSNIKNGETYLELSDSLNT